MKQYDYRPGDRFFDEILTFSMPFIALIALARFPELKTQIQLLVARANLILRGMRFPPETISNIVIPDKNAIIGKVVSSTLLGSQNLASEVQNARPISVISYVDEDLVTPEPGRRVVKPLPPVTLPPIAQVTIGAAHERAKSEIEARWGPVTSKWPPLLQYLRHCRNAAFHANHFDVRPFHGQPAIDPANPPTWRGSIMPDDATMNTKSLIGDWLDLGDVPILLGDVEELLGTSRISP